MTYDSYRENEIHCTHNSILTLLKQLASYEKIRRQIYSIPLSIRRRVIEYTPGDFTLLMNAAHVNRPDVIELLLLEGANPNEENVFGYTAFSYTRKSGVIGMLHAFSNMRWLGDIHLWNDRRRHADSQCEMEPHQGEDDDRDDRRNHFKVHET